MNDKLTEPKKKKAVADASAPVHTIRRGAVAASIWLRQSPSGYPYFEFSLSRSWKSMNTDKAGYSKSFFAKNQDELTAVIKDAASWIEAEEGKLSLGETNTARAA